MKKIAFVRTRYLPASETFIYEELKNIKRFKAIVFTRRRMNLNRFPFPRIKSLPRSSKKLARIFRRKRIRLIHARFGPAGIRLMKVKRKLGIPMITSFHGFDLPAKINRKKKYYRKLRKLFKVGSKFTVPSRQMKRQLRKYGCPRKKIKIMYSGINMKKFKYVKRHSSTENVTIISVGRLHKKKGFRYLIRAFKKVHRKAPTSRLIIVGDGVERKKLKRLISKLKLKKAVKLKGFVGHKRVAEMLKKADIFCLPSITTKDGNHEGIPNAIKEAMATGLPIVSTRHGGIPELVKDGREGFLVPEKNVRKLAKKLKHLVKNPSVRLKMGKRGRKRVARRFNSAIQVRRLESVYRHLIKKGRK